MPELKELFVEVTNFCCQKCIHCSSCAQFSHYPEISLIDLLHLVDSAIPLGLKRMTLSGGEPFLYSHLQDAVSYFGNKGLTTSIYTCGVIKNTNDELASIDKDLFISLRSYGLNRVIFSLHGSTAELQDSIAQTPGSFKFVMESIDHAVQAGLRVELHTVPMRSNMYGLEHIFEIAVKKHIHHVSLLRFVPQGRGLIDMEPTKDDYIWLRQSYYKWKMKFPSLHIRMGTPYNCISFAESECTAGLDKLLINAWGEYFPCEAFKFMHGQRPTIYNRDVKTEWENDPLLNALRGMKINDVSVCKTCEYRKQCLGGCAGQRLHRNGSLFLGPDPGCIIRDDL